MRSGYQGEQWQIERELNLMATPTELLWQPFSSLSGGEQTHVMLATLFRMDISPCLTNRLITLIRMVENKLLNI